MKMTIVTAKDGSIAAAHFGEAPQPDTSVITQLTEWRGGLLARPGQKLHMVDVPDTLLSVTSPAELETHLKAVLMPRSRSLWGSRNRWRPHRTLKRYAILHRCQTGDLPGSRGSAIF